MSSKKVAKNEWVSIGKTGLPTGLKTVELPHAMHISKSDLFVVYDKERGIVSALVQKNGIDHTAVLVTEMGVLLREATHYMLIDPPVIEAKGEPAKESNNENNS